MKKRSIKIAGHSTSISLEEPFWIVLKQLADEQETSLNALVEQVDKERDEINLSSALRLYVLSELQRRLFEVTDPSGFELDLQ
ncbi:MAG: ribbon-helix-helix domain-containing protein [Micavibrio aeruginosavorus]|uniref:Ribbon-helix-helix domain-containing protein n=1 Tax=Micavibrio aeruginosavorus TaxID=349221 RepID=A0A7T5UH36_9BACT|nr:MAG: ribbon-helix-helix domain-containing protein [Micavibrio aeruginosavorus]